MSSSNGGFRRSPTLARFDSLPTPIEGVQKLPGVRAAGAINGLPLMGEVWSKNLTMFDRPFPGNIRDLPSNQYRVVVGDYFRSMGIRVLNGRAFEDGDTEDSPTVVIVNQEAVRRFWNSQNAIGKIVSLNPPREMWPEDLLRQARGAGLPDDYAPPKFTVVGVVDDVRNGGLTSPALPTVYAPYAQASEGTTNMFLTVRTDGDPLGLVAGIRERIRQIDPNQPVAGIQTMEARLSASVSPRRTEMSVLAVFAVMALLLAAIGIYGVMSYWVTQRQREVGIRMALGARRQQVLRLVLRQSSVMLAIGLLLGLAGAFIATRVLRSLLFEVNPTDPAVFAVVALVLAASGSVAAYIPARRATRVDPVVTLRYD